MPCEGHGQRPMRPRHVRHPAGRRQDPQGNRLMAQDRHRKQSAGRILLDPDRPGRPCQDHHGQRRRRRGPDRRIVQGDRPRHGRIHAHRIPSPVRFHKDDSSHPFTLDNTHPDWTFASGFVNSPTPATVTVNGSKTLTGRDSKNGEASGSRSSHPTRPPDRPLGTRPSRYPKHGPSAVCGTAWPRTSPWPRRPCPRPARTRFDAAVDRTDCPGDLACSKAGYRITITAIGAPHPAAPSPSMSPSQGPRTTRETRPTPPASRRRRSRHAGRTERAAVDGRVRGPEQHDARPVRHRRGARAGRPRSETLQGVATDFARRTRGARPVRPSGRTVFHERRRVPYEIH